MTDRNHQISVGDLVQVVRWPCCGHWLGYTGTVTQIKHKHRECNQCMASMGDGLYAYVDCGYDGGFVTLERLKRIPPLEELESSKTDEPIKEPA